MRKPDRGKRTVDKKSKSLDRTRVYPGMTLRSCRTALQLLAIDTKPAPEVRFQTTSVACARHSRARTHTHISHTTMSYTHSVTTDYTHYRLHTHCTAVKMYTNACSITSWNLVRQLISQSRQKW